MADPLEGAERIDVPVDPLAAAQPATQPTVPNRGALYSPNPFRLPGMWSREEKPLPIQEVPAAWARSPVGRMALPALGATIGTALFPGAGTAAGWGIGAAGAGLGEVAREAIGREKISPGSITKEAALAGVAGPVAKYVGAPVVRGIVGSRYFPGGAALQKEAVELARKLTGGLPRPMTREAYEAGTAGARQAFETGEAAAQQTAKAVAQRFAETGPARAREIAKGLPVTEPDFATVTGYESVQHALTGQEPLVNTRALREAAEKVRDELAPIIKGWSGDPTLSESAKQLENFLRDTPDLLPSKLHEVLQHIGPLVGAAKRAGEPMTKVGGALSKLYQAGLRDLTAASEGGNIVATSLLEAMKQYKRKVAVGTLGQAIETGMRSTEGKLTYSADPLLKLLQAPGTKQGQRFVERLRQSLTPEEFASVQSRLGELAQKMTPRAPKKFAAQPFEEVPAIQDVVKQAISRRVGKFEEIAPESVVEALTPGTPTAKYLTDRLGAAKVAELRTAFEEMGRLPQIKTGVAGLTERLALYAPLSAMGLAFGGAPGIVGSAIGAEIARNRLMTPAGIRLVQRLAKMQGGRGLTTKLLQAGLPALGGLTSGENIAP